MTRGSWIHDEVSLHFKGCTQCREADPETIRVLQPEALRRTVPDEVLAKLCPNGRSIYQSYLRWLAEPDD
jgi:hypothetical protein